MPRYFKTYTGTPPHHKENPNFGYEVEDGKIKTFSSGRFPVGVGSFPINESTKTHWNNTSHEFDCGDIKVTTDGAAKLYERILGISDFASVIEKEVQFAVREAERRREMDREKYAHRTQEKPNDQGAASKPTQSLKSDEFASLDEREKALHQENIRKSK